MNSGYDSFALSCSASALKFQKKPKLILEWKFELETGKCSSEKPGDFFVKVL